MLSYEVYKMLHYLGLMLLFFGLGGVFVPALAGLKLQSKPRMLAFISHGIGMLLLLVAGFGMLARLPAQGTPQWIYVKLVVWLFLGAAVALSKRMPSWIVLLVILAVAMVAPYMALYKPF